VKINWGNLGAGLVAVWIISDPQAQAQPPVLPKYAADGQLLVPGGYETWVFVGSNLGLSYKQDMPAVKALEATLIDKPLFHNVYINPEAYSHFQATAEFPDPTILVMEVFVAADKEPKNVIAGGVYNGERTGVEVAVKNASRPDGAKTVWAYYDFTDQSNPSKLRSSAPAFPDQVCENCHRQHASKDNVWVQFYPALRKPMK
jgi:hypothetical protein